MFLRPTPYSTGSIEKAGHSNPRPCVFEQQFDLHQNGIALMEVASFLAELLPLEDSWHLIRVFRAAIRFRFFLNEDEIVRHKPSETFTTPGISKDSPNEQLQDELPDPRKSFRDTDGKRRSREVCDLNGTQSYQANPDSTKKGT